MLITGSVQADRLAPVEPDQVVAGIDWALQDHAVAVVDATGRVVERFTVARTASGLRELISRLRRHRAREVAIERPDGQVVETLLAAGVTVVVISPNQVENLRSRYGQTGNKDDRFDGFVLADTLRTDRARLRTLVPDTPATVTLRAAVRARKDLVHHRVALANQLRAHLHAFYPAPTAAATTHTRCGSSGPGLGVRRVALLAGRHRLRPRRTCRAATPHPPDRPSGGMKTRSAARRVRPGRER